MRTKRLTPKEHLPQNPDQFVMVTYEFGEPIFITPLKGMEIQTTLARNEAEVWSELDNTPNKLQYHIASTGYSGFIFEKISLPGILKKQ